MLAPWTGKLAVVQFSAWIAPVALLIGELAL
jgi:hypothetical protein